MNPIKKSDYLQGFHRSWYEESGFLQKKRIHFPARKMLSSWSRINSNWKNRWLVESTYWFFFEPFTSIYLLVSASHPFWPHRKKSQVAHSRYCSTTKHDSSDPTWELRTSKPEKTVPETGGDHDSPGTGTHVHLPPHQNQKRKWWKIDGNGGSWSDGWKKSPICWSHGEGILGIFFVWGKSGCLLFFFEEKTVPAERFRLGVQSDFDVKIRWKSPFRNDDWCFYLGNLV